jgi:hypothetical protein
VNARLIAGVRHRRSHVRFPISDVTDTAGFKETGKGSFTRMKLPWRRVHVIRSARSAADRKRGGKGTKGAFEEGERERGGGRRRVWIREDVD